MMTSTLLGASGFKEIWHSIENLLLFASGLVLEVILKTSDKFQVSFHFADVP